jgi:hypothetical protein
MPETFQAVADLIANPRGKAVQMRTITIRITPALDFSLRFMAEKLEIPHTRLASMLLDTAAEQFGPICKKQVESVPGNLMSDPRPSQVGELIGEGLDENSALGTRTKEEHEADFLDQVKAMEDSL